MELKKLATFIGFPCNDRSIHLKDQRAITRTALRCVVFKGCLLGINGDEYVAAFRTDEDAWRFLLTYYDGEPHYTSIGAYALSSNAIITIKE